MVETLWITESCPAGIVADLPEPTAEEAAKSPCWDTVNDTLMPPEGAAPVEAMVKAAFVPSVMLPPAWMLSSGGAASRSSSVIAKLATEPLPLTPPRPVWEAAPRPTVTVSPPLSTMLSWVAVKVSVATLDAPAPPVKITRGGLAERLLLARFSKRTPVGSVPGAASV